MGSLKITLATIDVFIILIIDKLNLNFDTEYFGAWDPAGL